jgi:uncharacterized protein (DUF2237 family)
MKRGESIGNPVIGSCTARAERALASTGASRQCSVPQVGFPDRRTNDRRPQGGGGWDEALHAGFRPPSIIQFNLKITRSVWCQIAGIVGVWEGTHEI